jgi:hypothetical protein
VVSVGANTDENLFNALSGAWDKTVTPKQHSAAHPYIYSWNATVPGSTSTKPVSVVPKKGCAPVGLRARTEGRRRQRADQGLPAAVRLGHALVLAEDARPHRAGQLRAGAP